MSYSLGAGDLRTLDALVDAMRKRSMQVIVVLTLGGDERGILWWSSSLQDSFVEVWRQLALRYQSDAGIAGFDLLNEPVPPGKSYDVRESTWLAYAERLGTAIRAADAGRALIVESAPDATPTSFDNLRPLPLGNVVYSVHSYFPMALTHQGVMKPYDEPVAYDDSPTAEHGRQELYGYLAHVAAFAKRYDVPIRWRTSRRRVGLGPTTSIAAGTAGTRRCSPARTRKPCGPRAPRSWRCCAIICGRPVKPCAFCSFMRGRSCTAPTGSSSNWLPD
jgi:hypothetical protein